MTHAERFRAFLKDTELVMLPGCYDAIGAKLIELAGFNALYITGSGVSLTTLGHPDINTISYSELLQKVYQIRNAVNIPMLVDIDTGFGGPLNIIRLVKDFEQLDIAAIQIEDQIAPKRCGHEVGRKVVPVEEMINRIRAVVETRKDNGIVLVARTDAFSTLGRDEAIRRANMFLEAGADVAFVESPETKDDIARIAREVKGPVLFNNVEGGKSPFMHRDELQKDGFRFVIYPNAVTRVVCKKVAELLATLKETGSTESMWDQMMDHKAVWELFGSEEYYALESKYTSFRE